MSYVDAIHDRNTNTIKVVEQVDGSMVLKEYPARYVFYYEDVRGKYKSDRGKPCSKYETNDYKKFQAELAVARESKIVHEHDINPIFRCLGDNYKNKPMPNLNIAFFDIEVDFDPTRGFADPWDPFARITAISVHLSQHKETFTLVLKPDLPTNDPYYLTDEKAEEICGKFPNTVLFSDELTILETFVDLVQESNVITGFNSTQYDIPYVINRIERIGSKDITSRLCLWNEKPKKRKYMKFKKEQMTYDLVGRVHMDYLDLYQKYTYIELPSYRLDYVGEVEVGENKVPYDGTLDQLYKRDFEKFIGYNRQDVDLLVKIDKKLRFISLSNQIAHDNLVLLQTTMGSVAWIDQSIVLEIHGNGMIAPSKKKSPGEDKIPAAGAYVAEPVTGLIELLASGDINSLYPSAIRALNMGTDTIIGQINCLKTKRLVEDRIASGASPTEAWHEIFCAVEFDDIQNKTDDIIEINFDNGETVRMKAVDVHEMIYGEDSQYILSANGTIFRKDIKGIIPQLLEKWYAQRKEEQAKAKSLMAVYYGLDAGGLENLKPSTNVADGNKFDIGKVRSYIEEKNVEAVEYLMNKYDMRLEDGKLVFADPEAGYEIARFHDQRQHAKKIQLNSLYGSLLNVGSRFYDQRIGQSTTLTGRSITRHMISTTNQITTGKYDYKGDAIIYSDTDSVYFSVVEAYKKDPSNPLLREIAPLFDDKTALVEYYDIVIKQVNDTFPAFMNEKFNTGLDRGSIVKAGREIVGSRGLFLSKKRYAIMVYDDEGNRVDVNGKPGKLKIMGLEIKRSDTPKFVQEFLQDILTDVLDGKTEDDVIEKLREFRTSFRNMDPWLKGSPKKVNGLTNYMNRIEEINANPLNPPSNLRIPGHAQASINWNHLKRINNDHYSSSITDGSKVIVCRLRQNHFGMKSIAYPVDDQKVPDWFTKLPFHNDMMEENIIDKKVDNILGILGWDLSSSKIDSDLGDLFSF